MGGVALSPFLVYSGCVGTSPYAYLHSNTMFLLQTVAIPSFRELQAFLSIVPHSYGRFIQELDVCTQGSIQPSSNNTDVVASTSGSMSSPRTDGLMGLLSRTPRLQRLTLRLHEGLHPKIAPSFRELDELISLKIENCDNEEKAPL